MVLSTGTRLGSFEILSLIGSGGMGEVYRARDSKLNRDVALKVLPDSFANDPDRLARFTREAQVLASLNHPNIAHIHGIEESAGVRALVMELVEGEDLAQRIARGRIPLDAALLIAKQIVEALEVAHEQGIIHRDLKPANIKVRADGTVKVLDFGLAKALDPVVGADVTNSPTITFAATQAGVILGTAGYMSPEQAKGRAADKRSDVWGFGCVLYEMLTARRAFQGDDVSDTLATVLKSDPDWHALPSTLPASIRLLLDGCLKKDRRERIGDMSTVTFLLNQSHAEPTSPGLSSPSAWKRAGLIGVGAAIGVASAVGMSWLKPSPAAPVTRFAYALPQGQQLSLARQAVDISPDGSRIVYAVDGRLYLRSMSDLEPKVIAGAEPAVNPVFSPDGQSVAFWSDSGLKRIGVSGGTVVPICQSGVAPNGMSWGTDAILFTQRGDGIMRVSPNGGKPELLVGQKDSLDMIHGPQMLPDGRTLLFTIARGPAAVDIWDKALVVVQSLKTGERKTLIDGGFDARYIPTGHIVYVVGGTLFAVPFDLAKLEVTGGAVPIVEGIRRVNSASFSTAHFAWSNSGSLVYVSGPASGGQDLFLFGRTGGAEAMKLPPGSYLYPRVSPDGKRLAFETSDGKQAIISIYELSGASLIRRLTFGGNNRFPIWSGDGQRVAFQSDRDGDRAVFWQPIDGGPAERLTKPQPGTLHVPESWSPDGNTLLYSVTEGGATSLWRLSIHDRKAIPFGNVRSTSLPTNAAFSPDGRWVAYQTAEVGAGEATTYVEPFPPDGRKYQIARGGRPLWSRDGKELFYVPAPNQFMAVTIRTQPAFSVSNPIPVPRGFGIADPANPRTFDITPQGQIVGPGPAGLNQNQSMASAQIHVVLNWFEELKARVPTK